jgi:transmembrane sensor
MERKVQPKLNTQIYEEACDWFVEFRGGDLDTKARREFDLWVRKSPEHLAAYLEIAAIWNEGPSLDPKQEWPADTLIAQAAEDPDNVVQLSRGSPDDPSHVTPIAELTADFPHRRIPWPRAAAAIASVGFAIGALIWTQYFRVPTYTTAIGEQRSIALADGSVVELNSRSKIQIRYSQQERDVDLLEGQALFHVAKDHARPFVVAADGTRVRAVGTQFDVYEKASGTVVTVVEGRVAILRAGAAELDASDGLASGSAISDISASASTSTLTDFNTPTSDIPNAVYLSAGEQLTVTPKTEQKTAHPNVASATAWTQRQLVFESASLSDVAEEFNRYNGRQLVIQDPKLYDFHISGVFSSTDPASLIRFLRQRPGVKVIETASEIRVARNIS